MAAEDTIRVAPVRNRADRQQFLALPGKLHAKDPNWISPLLSEEAKKLDPRKHPFFRHGEAEFWIAWRDDQPVGRIAGIINRLHLERYGDNAGHFGMIEAIDDSAVFRVLLQTAGEWLKSAGMKKMYGPVSLSINEEVGLLVEGFDHPPMLLMGHVPPYYATHLEAVGLQKAKDLNAFLIDMQNPLPAKLLDLEAQLRKRTEFTIRSINKAKIDQELRLAVEIFNDAWSENWGFVPLTEAEADDFIKSFKPVIAQDCILFAERDGYPAAIMASVPNINEHLKDLDGRLLPFGWIKLLWRLKFAQVKTGRVFFMGVRKEFHGTLNGAGLPLLMMLDVLRAGRERGIEKAELSWVLEDNASINGYFRAAEIPIYKVYRVYEGGLDIA